MNLRYLACALLCLPLLACYEEPVRDHLHIAFAAGPAIVVTAVRDVADPDVAGDNTAVEERVREAQTDLESGWDRWSRSFTELDAFAERSTIERREGRARRGIHSALVDSFRPLERLLGHEGLGAVFEEAGGLRELQLFPTGAGQATRQQRDRLEGQLREWSQLVAEYFEAATALYAYLERAPERAVPCLAHVFDIRAEESGPLRHREEELVTAVKRTMEPVADVLLIETGDAYSLNELSRLVFDTFQGRLTIAVDGPVTEIVGFVDHTDHVERPPVDLWSSLESMSALWLSPDLVTAMVGPGPDATQPEPDPVAFAGLPRRWEPPPDAWAVESELRSRLRPEEVYRVRWRTRPVAADDDEVVLTAFRMLADAENNLPE